MPSFAFATAGPVAALVEVAGAHVQITATDRTDTQVRVEPIDPGRGKDVKVAERTTVDFDGGRLAVKTTVSGDKAGSVAITIDLPIGSSLNAYLAHSDIRADGAYGDCELHMASGRIHVERSTALRANISSGHVEVGHIDGRADIDGGAFTTRIGHVEGPVRLSNSGGQVWIGHATADVDMRTASCDFDIDRADGDITATTANGAIRIGQMTGGRAKLTNGSGNIQIGIGDRAAASIDVDSERGTVHDTVTSQANPDPSDHNVSVYARTRHGDITIQRTPHNASVASTN